ncbi:uncharacterized protein LOC105380570 [Plutella xylostella]|uniref:uncharacterized protein LOC105380570 n=1 Tax=Plutella xylostella TaxID=51655 RepID=UPI0020330E8C|nr:uncharacterized protein LOC105380570 [Plutella xylostella]
MDSPKIVYKYYSNPAFCAQSEVVFAQKSPCITSKIIAPDRQRMPPLGANSPRKTVERGNRITRTDISDNPLRMAPAGAYRSQDIPPALPPKPAKYSLNNTYSGGFHRQSSMIVRPTVRSSFRSRTRSEDLEMAQFRQQKQIVYDRNAESDDGLEDSRYSKHRYEVIKDDFDDLVDYCPTKKRIVEAKEEEINEYNVDGPDENEMKEIPTEIVKTVNGKTLRYAIVPLEDDDPEPRRPTVTFSPMMSKKNLIATQKLHELLSTPRKLKSYASQPSVRMTPSKDSPRYVSTPKKLATSTPTHGVTPSKSCANLTLSRGSATTSPISPKAQQKLSYELEENDRSDIFVRSYRERSHDRSLDLDRRERESRRDYDRRVRDSKRPDKSTAVIVPRVAAPVASTYSDDTYKSWSTVKGGGAATATLAVAALMMTLCGALTSGLSFFMMYSIGRVYYLDFGVLSGFTCLLLGLLGFRSRKHQLLPNRNYISGYILLSTFSILSAGGLLLLLSLQPRPGTPLSDVTSGAVCGLSVLSLAVASLGVVTSYCCKHPPPDNRVANARWY